MKKPKYTRKFPLRTLLGVAVLGFIAGMYFIFSGHAASTPTWSCNYGSYKAGTWPDSCWRPYSDNSFWNTPLPVAPKLNPNSSAIVSKTLSLGTIGNLDAGNTDTASDFSKPTYYSQPSDPIFTIHCTQPWGVCGIEGHQIRIPDQARPAAGGDGHMTVVDQTSGWEYDFWQVTSKPSGGGRLDTSWGGRTRIDGDGAGSDATASKFGNLGGIIRVEELEAGVIPHALFLVVRCGTNSPQYVFPAQKGDAICTDTTNAPPMGTHFYLDMTDAEVSALQVPQWKKTILTAMAHYGMFFGDTGGPGFGVQIESSTTYTSFGYEDKLMEFARNNGWTPWNNVLVGNLGAGVDWSSRLKVVDPCVSQKTCVTTKPGDINSDGKVSALDLSLLLSNFGKSGTGLSNPAIDLNKDGSVTIIDLSILLSNYGK